MKNLSFFFFLFLSLFFSSCSKEDTRPDCEKNNQGYLVVSNASSNPYEIYVSGNYKFRVEGNTVTNQMPIPTGLRLLIEARQASGYNTTPTVKEFINTITSCSAYSIQIPQEVVTPVIPDCQARGYGSLTITNKSSNPYDVTYGTVTFRLQGNATSDVLLLYTGNRSIYVKQVSGYALYPTEKTYYKDIVICGNYTLDIPL